MIKNRLNKYNMINDMVVDYVKLYSYSYELLYVLSKRIYKEVLSMKDFKHLDMDKPNLITNIVNFKVDYYNPNSYSDSKERKIDRAMSSIRVVRKAEESLDYFDAKQIVFKIAEAWFGCLNVVDVYLTDCKEIEVDDIIYDDSETFNPRTVKSPMFNNDFEVDSMIYALIRAKQLNKMARLTLSYGPIVDCESGVISGVWDRYLAHEKDVSLDTSMNLYWMFRDTHDKELLAKLPEVEDLRAYINTINK